MITIKNLNKTYDRGHRNANKVLHDVSFTLPETGFVCILGASGCGKTSLLNAIGGLDSFDNGTIATGDVSVSRYGTRAYEAERNRSFGYIFQNYYLLMDHSVAYNVYMGLHSLDLSHKEKLQRVRQALKAVEMERYIRRTVGELSGGQQQRIAIARALARRPRIIFADEPTGNLDEANTLNICTLLRKISKQSLVVMVTHEERIANFFADRIITLSEGRIRTDTSEWERKDLSAEGAKTLYSGDYAAESIQLEGIDLRLLREEGAEPVQLTLLATKDRIVIKLSDSRTVSCGTPDQAPALAEGKRPTLTLETVEQDDRASYELFSQPEAAQTKAGQGLTMPMIFREALRLSGGKGLQRVGMKLFLVLLSILTVLTVSDYLTVSSLDPEDFITTDSHILELEIAYGNVLRQENSRLQELVFDYMDYLEEADVEMDFVPHISPSATYSASDLFPQMEDVAMTFGSHSYIPLEYFDESTLIYGRMPQTSGEIIVDRWVLDAAAAKDGIIQNSIPDASYFLGAQISYTKKNYSPTIVGICDSGEPAVYISKAGLVSLGVTGTGVISLSELQTLCPGKYDDVTLTDEECLVVTNVAGMGYQQRIGGFYSTTVRSGYTIKDTIEEELVSAAIVVNDAQIPVMLWDMANHRFYLYCPDKDAVKAFLAQPSQLEQDGYITVKVLDKHTTTWNAYQAASHLKADARTIVTVTIIVLAMAMLYLLCRTQAQQRLGMLAVYRLLGIPKRKLAVIFAVESIITSLTTALPAAILTWLGVKLAGMVPDWNISLILPLTAALAVYGAILIYHLVVCLLPLGKLLKLPPAQLAAKYDM